MWTVVFITCDTEAVSGLRDKLTEAGILVRVVTVLDNGEDDACFKVMVPFAELNAAQDIIIDYELNI